MNYGTLWDLYNEKRIEAEKNLEFTLFGVKYEVITIGLFDHKRDLAEILLKSVDLEMEIKLDIPISFTDMHSWLTSL
jgi:hypothetical protein